VIKYFQNNGNVIPVYQYTSYRCLTYRICMFQLGKNKIIHKYVNSCLNKNNFHKLTKCVNIMIIISKCSRLYFSNIHLLMYIIYQLPFIFLYNFELNIVLCLLYKIHNKAKRQCSVLHFNYKKKNNNTFYSDDQNFNLQ